MRTAIGAARDAGILHRDISLNNIMLNAEGKVVVNDWDHAGMIERDPKGERQAFRTVSVTIVFSLRCRVLTGILGHMAFHVDRYARRSVQDP